MIINDIEYCVTLYPFSDDDYPEELIAFFEDFNALNDFIKEHEEVYKNQRMCYSVVEVIEGEPESFSWVNELKWQAMSDAQVKSLYDDCVEIIEDIEKERNAFKLCDEEFSIFESVDYMKKRERLNDFSYVCPRCLRELDDCRCKSYPYNLIQIDKLILPIIRELNSKGYITKWSCAGHPNRDKLFSIYIVFKENYEFDEPFPAGGKYSKSNCSITYFAPDDCDDLLAFQTKILSELEFWAEMLDDLNDPWCFDEEE